MIKLQNPVAVFLLVFTALTSAAPSQRQESQSARVKEHEAAGKEAPKAQAPSRLPKNVASLIRSLPKDTEIGIVVLDHRGKVVFQHNSDRELPAASSIKSILLLELFSRYADELDVEDRDDIAEIVRNAEHPAIENFGSKDRELIANQLAEVSIKQLGSILIDSKDLAGNKYSNSVYNAAANVAIALLGGPEELTGSIKQRNDEFKNVNFRRYMLTDRNVAGDNTATPKAIATLFHITVGKTPFGMKPRTAGEIAGILHSTNYKNGARLYAKGGTLHSDPVTHVRSGQYQKGKIRMNYAIMAKQKLKSTATAQQQYASLQKLTEDVYSGLKNPQ